MSVTIVVTDTSPLRALEHLGLLGLSRGLYSEAFVPLAVIAELESPPSGMTIQRLYGNKMVDGQWVMIDQRGRMR